MSGSGAAEDFAEIFGERVEEDVFDREGASVMSVEFATSFGLADMDLDLD